MATQDTINAIGTPDIYRYECENAYGLNRAATTEFSLEYSYEMLFDCSSASGLTASDGMKFIEETLLHRAKTEFLKTAEQCSLPQDYWFAALDTRPNDVALAKACTHFATSGEDNMCCSVVQGNMTFVQLRAIQNVTHMWDWSRRQFTLDNGDNAIHTWDDNEFTTHYLGTNSKEVVVNTGGDVSPTTNDGIPPPQPQAVQDDGGDGVTGTGVAFVLFLILCVLGAAGYFWYRNRTKNGSLMFGTTMTKSEDEDLHLNGHDNYDDDEDLPESWIEPRRLPQSGADAMNGERNVPSSKISTKVPHREFIQHSDGSIEEGFDDGMGEEQPFTQTDRYSSPQISNARQQRNQYYAEESPHTIPAHPDEYE